jgi:hypothetical protein
MSDRMARRFASRRELLAGAAIAAAASVAASPDAVATDATAGDVRLLRMLLGVEQRVSSAYRRVLAAGVLGVVVASEITGFLDQEQRHIGALELELGLRNSKPPPAARIEPGRHVETQADALEVLLAAETMAEGAYFGAVSKFGDSSLVTLGAEIMASEAQHWTLLRAIQSPDKLAVAAPAAYVTGST